MTSRMLSLTASFVVATATLAAAPAPVVYSEPTYAVENSSGVVYGRGLSCANVNGTEGCEAMNLLLDVTAPVGAPAGPRPAIIFMHGGGWVGGSANDSWARASAAFYASRGFMCFRIKYRLQQDNGSFPTNWKNLIPYATNQELRKLHGAMRAAIYPATRDLKAAIRFVRANAARFGVDPERIALAGGSAGAISSIGAGVVDETDYKNELLATDPTLATTYLNTSSAVQCVVSHWGAGYAALIVQGNDPTNRSRYSYKSSPIIEFHGDKDTTVPFGDALAVEAAYHHANSSGNLAYELHVLAGCAHAAWCAGCGTQCGCAQHTGWCHAQDTAALPFVARHLKLDLRGHSPRPLPLPGKCAAELTKDGCTASIGAGACDRCAGAHQSDLKAAGCTRTFVKDFCAKPSGAD